MVKEPFQFDPIDLLDWTRWRLRLFSDFDLAKKLKTSPSAISKIRRGHQMMGAGILLRILDLTDPGRIGNEALIKIHISKKSQQVCAFASTQLSH